MTPFDSGRAFALGITLSLVLGLLAGCSGHAPGELGELQAKLETCPDVPVNLYGLVDGTATSQDASITQEHLSAIEVDIERVAICGGHITVAAFGTNSVTTPIYEADLVAPGSTAIAKLRRVPGMVEDAMFEVTENYSPAIALLPEGGTDVTGQFRLLGEARDLRPDMQLQANLYTDGLNNQGIVIDHALTEAEATALADSVAVPDLSGATVSVIGIGRVSGDPLSSDFIAGLKAFYTRLCANTKADSCLVVTDDGR